MKITDKDDNSDLEYDEEENYSNKNYININISDIDKIITSNIIESICKLKIELQDGGLEFANGFFCYIPSKEMRVFITNNHVIDQNYLDNKTEIKCIIENNDNEKEEERIISLKTKRFITTSKELDATIIEILDKDNIKSFFEVDEKFIQNKDLKGDNIISLFCQNEQKPDIFFGKILESSGNFFKINARIESIPPGSPIISLDGIKIIGLHKGCSSTLGKKQKQNLGKNQKQNLGVILDKIIRVIPNSNCSLNNNVIKCTYKINIKDINKDIIIYDNCHNIEDKKRILLLMERKRKKNILKMEYIGLIQKENIYFVFILIIL
jgi:hypothetical protein